MKTIVTQNREAVINYEEISMMRLCVINDKYAIKAIMRGGADVVIAQYKSEEKRNWVFKNIWQKLSPDKPDINYVLQTED